MKAVNLIPKDSRRDSSDFSVGTLGPAHFVIGLGAVLVVLVLMHVLTANTVKDRKATLAAVNTQVVQEQATAAKLAVYTAYITQAEAREQQVLAIANSRFPWRRSFDQLAHVIPATTSLTSLSASTAGASGSTTPAATSTANQSVPVFTLSGCADTRDQDGVAALIRRLHAITGVTSVNFESSTRTPDCGNSFSLSIVFKAILLPGTAAAPTTTTSTTTTASGSSSK
jgi:Tfp pilus assembly protein PilN